MADKLTRDFWLTVRARIKDDPLFCAAMDALFAAEAQGKDWRELPQLYEIAKDICHERGWPWTDPRTGITYPPPLMEKQ